MNWKDEPLLRWLSRREPSWANDRILRWSDVFPRDTEPDVMGFVIKEHRNSNTTIDMRTVVGQWDHYAGQTWAEALLDPQWKPGKIKYNLERADENPNYYFNGEIQGDINLYSIDGTSWYSFTSGNHRTIIAKFLSEMRYDKTGHYPIVVGVSTTQYVVDWKSYHLFKYLLEYKDIGIHISLHTRGLEENLLFHVGDFRFNRDGKFEHLTPDQFRAYARWVIHNRGNLTKWDRLQHWRQFFWGDQRKLVFFS